MEGGSLLQVVVERQAGNSALTLLDVDSLAGQIGTKVLVDLHLYVLSIGIASVEHTNRKAQ